MVTLNPSSFLKHFIHKQRTIWESVFSRICFAISSCSRIYFDPTIDAPYPELVPTRRVNNLFGCLSSVTRTTIRNSTSVLSSFLLSSTRMHTVLYCNRCYHSSLLYIMFFVIRQIKILDSFIHSFFILHHLHCVRTTCSKK